VTGLCAGAGVGACIDTGVATCAEAAGLALPPINSLTSSS
jgi:hypothetical protein